MLLLCMVVAAIFVGVLLKSSMVSWHQLQRVSWILLRLLNEYGSKLEIEEAISIIINSSMGIITISRKNIRSVIKAQVATKLIKQEGNFIEITYLGKAHLNSVTKIVLEEREDNEAIQN